MALKTGSILLSLALFATQVAAEPQRFSLTLPAFNGSVANGSYYISMLEAQRPEFTQRTNTPSSSNELENFDDQLRRRVLSALASNIVSSIYGTDLIQDQTFIVGDLEVMINEDTSNPNNICITTTDGISINSLCVPR